MYERVRVSAAQRTKDPEIRKKNEIHRPAVCLYLPRGTDPDIFYKQTHRIQKYRADRFLADLLRMEQTRVARTAAREHNRQLRFRASDRAGQG